MLRSYYLDSKFQTTNSYALGAILGSFETTAGT